MLDKAFQNLSSEQRKQLMVAFEEGFDQIIRIDDKHFIGVHVQNNGEFRILETNDIWSYGEYIK